MKALIYRQRGGEVRDKAKPVIVNPTDAVVKVTLSSICTSDLHIKHGSVPRAVPGVTVGHEMVGVVESVGEAVTKVKPGGRVAVNVETFCGEWFFKTVQNKMHFSADGHTAAEVIFQRADAEKDFMGLITWRGAMPTKHEAEIAKNYLTEDEVDMLNRIVNLYLDFAELQAKSHVPMYMKDWIKKLDDFLTL